MFCLKCSIVFYLEEATAAIHTCLNVRSFSYQEI